MSRQLILGGRFMPKKNKEIILVIVIIIIVIIGLLNFLKKDNNKIINVSKYVINYEKKLDTCKNLDNCSLPEKEYYPEIQIKTNSQKLAASYGPWRIS